MRDTEGGTLHTSEIIAMAWCDKTSFEDIRRLTGLSEAETIALMRRELKASSFRLWRRRVSGRSAKHAARMRKKSQEISGYHAGRLV